MPLIKGQLATSFSLPTNVEVVADTTDELLLIDSNDELFRIAKSDFLSGVSSSIDLTSVNNSIAALQASVTSKISVPSTIKTLSASADFFIGIDAGGILYRISRADLLAGLSSGDGNNGSVNPTSFTALPEEIVVVSGAVKTLSPNSSYTYTGKVAYQEPPAVNDTVKFNKLLAPGNYRLQVITNIGNIFGIVQLEVDEVLQFNNLDNYATSITLNHPVERNITIVGDGDHEFKFKVFSKNPSSSNYYFSIQQITGVKI